jgi:hypothetical protein
MSHPTHVGFSAPEIRSAKRLMLPARNAAQFGPERPLWSLDVGVGSIRPVPPSWRTASVRLMPGCAFDPGVFLDPDDFASPPVGVGQSLADTASFRLPPCRPQVGVSVPP